MGELQRVLGNSGLEQLQSGEEESPAAIYLRHISEVTAETGIDMTGYLPWNAPPSWSRVVQPLYRVLSAEAGREAPAQGAEVEGINQGATEDTALDVASPVARKRNGDAPDDQAWMMNWLEEVSKFGGGRELTEEEQSLLEQVHGRRFPGARVHEGGVVRAAASAIGARAFTIGQDIYLGESADVSSSSGAELLAHEVTHVAQAEEGRLRSSGPMITDPSESTEKEAEARGRDARKVAATWGVESPVGIDAGADAMLRKVVGELPYPAPEPPMGLVEEGLSLALRNRLYRSEGEGAVAEIDALPEAEHLSALLSHVGAPTEAELAGLQSEFAPYPDFAMAAGGHADELVSREVAAGTKFESDSGTSVTMSGGTEGAKFGAAKDLIPKDIKLQIPLYGAVGAGFWFEADPDMKVMAEAGGNSDGLYIKGSVVGRLRTTVKGGVGNTEGLKAAAYGGADLNLTISGISLSQDEEGGWSLGPIDGGLTGNGVVGLEMGIDLGLFTFKKTIEYKSEKAEFLRFSMGGWSDRDGATGAFEVSPGADLAPVIETIEWLYDEARELLGLEDPAAAEYKGWSDEENFGEGECVDVQGYGGRLDGWEVQRKAKEAVWSGGVQLPHFEELQKRFGRHDISGAKAHVGGSSGQIAADLGAEAFATGGDIVFQSGSVDLHTAAHEAAHVVQQAAGVSLTDGVGEKGDRYERHADAVADRVVAGQSAESLLSSFTGGVTSGLSSAGDVQKEEVAGGEGGSMPKEITLKMGGVDIKIPLDGGTNPAVTVNNPDCPVPGMEISRADIKFGSDWTVESGEMITNVTVGEFIQIDDMGIRIGAEGEISGTIPSVPFNIENLVAGEVELYIGSDGISGSGSVSFERVTLKEGFDITGGSLDISFDTEGNLTCSGSLTGEIGGLGSLTVTASYEEQQFRLELEAVPDESLEIIDGVRVTAGRILGVYDHTGLITLGGGISLAIGGGESGDWATADLDGEYLIEEQLWDFTGTLSQAKELMIDELAVTNASITLTVESNVPVEVTATADYTWRTFAGNLSGTYDIGASAFSGAGTCSLTEPMELLEGEVVVNSFEAQLNIEDNLPTTATLTANIHANWEEQPTFNVDLEGTLDVMASIIDGTGNFSTLREVQFGDTAVAWLSVPAGAEANVVVSQNALTEITGGLAFIYQDTAGEIAAGTVEGSFADGMLNANGEATLITTYGLPSREAGPLFFDEGMVVTLEVAESQLQRLAISGGSFKLLNPAGEGQGLVAGTFSGEINGEGVITGQGEASIVEQWPLIVSWGAASLEPGGTANIAVEESAISSIDMKVPFAATVESATPIELDGEVEASYDGATETISGQITANLLNEVTIPVKEDQLRLLPDTTVTATVEANELSEISMALHAIYVHGGEDLLEGTIPDATYNVADKALSFNGEFVLLKTLEHEGEAGNWAARLLAEETLLRIAVESNDVTEIGGEAAIEVDDSAGLLLQGNLRGVSIRTEDWAVSGEVEVALARELSWPKEGEEAAPGFSLSLLTGSGVKGTLADGQFTTVELDGQFRLDQIGSELALGAIQATVDVQASTLVGGGVAVLTRPFMLGQQGEGGASGQGSGAWLGGISAGSGVAIQFNEAGFTRAQIGAAGFLQWEGEEVANGTLEGTWAPGDEAGFEGCVHAAFVKRLPWSTGDRFDTHVDVGTQLDVIMANSAVQSASGTMIMMFTEASQDSIRASVAADFVKDQPISASGSVEVLRDMVVAGGEFILYLTEGSGGTAHVAQDKLQSLDGKIGLRLDKDGAPLMKGDFAASYLASEGESANISGDGTVELLSPIDLGNAGEFGLIIQPGTTVSASVLNSELQGIEGGVDFSVSYGGGPFLEGQVQAQYIHGQDPIVSATGSVDVVAEMDFGIQAGEYSIILMPGTGATFDLRENNLISMGGVISTRVFDTGGELLDVELGGTYDHQGGTFDGVGKATLLRRVTVAENVGDSGYSFFIEPEATSIEAKVSQAGVEEVTGILKVGVDDREGPFLAITAEGRWVDGDEPMVSVIGSVDLVSERLLAETSSGYSIYLETLSAAEVVVVNNELKSIGGLLCVRLEKGGEEFARIILSGNYSDTTGFDGVGQAELLTEIAVGEMGEYSLFLDKGVGATMTINSNELVRIGGTIPVRIDEGSKPFIQGALTGTYDVPTKMFSGTGTAAILFEKELAELGGQRLFLCPSSSAQVTIGDNVLQSIGGGVILALHDDGGKWIEINLEGSFDAAGGTGFSGTGSSTVLREKCLFGAAGQSYSFWLVPGAGMVATIKENALTAIGGTVPFQVQDEEGPLIEGAIAGAYDLETGLFTGNGAVFLGRDLTYELGGGTKVVFEKGSGGGGEVVDSELRSLTGTLTCMIWKDDEPLVWLSANGEYDAVRKMLVKVEGTAVLQRPFELMDGLVIIEGITGQAKIQNNELVAAGGAGTVRIPSMNEMTGTFNVNWSNEGGKDVYSGSGQLSFTLFDDASTGRKTTGTVAVAYSEDGRLTLGGQIEYQMNELFGGTIGVAMDISEGMEMDPVLSGSIAIETDLVEGRDLFRMEIPILPDTPVVICPGVFLSFGALGSMALVMDPLHLSTVIGVDNFHPLALDQEVPDFNASLALDWGMTFEAMLAAYMSLELGVPGASAGAGLRGEAVLEAPLDVMADGMLSGGKDGFRGEIGIGMALSANMMLRAIPFVRASLVGMEAKHDFGALECDLGELFKFEWGSRYVFGDVEESVPQATTEMPSGEATQSDKEHSEAPAMPSPSSTGAQNVEGGPQLESGSDIAGEEPSGGQDQMGEMMKTVDQVKILAAGLGALANLGKLIMGLITATLTLGPIGFLMYLVYELVFGDLSWEGIKQSVNDVVDAVTVGAEMLKPFLPEWLNDIIDVFQGEKPGLMDALFGADDAMRKEVRNGNYRHAPPDLRYEMVKQMLDGWTGEADQECILKVLYFSSSKGDIRTVVPSAKFADWIISDLDGTEDSQARKIFKRHGIKW